MGESTLSILSPIKISENTVEELGGASYPSTIVFKLERREFDYK